MTRGPWLATVTSFAFPRTFATSTVPSGFYRGMGTDEILRHATERAGQDHHVCFTARITDGPKTAAGREVEVQLQVDDAERLARQILRVVELHRTNTPPKGDSVT